MTPLQTVRRILFVILVMGMSGSLLELFLLKHDEDTLQLIPLVLLGAGLVTIVWHAARPARLSAGAVRMVMLGFVLAGFTGVYLHYRANVEFQLEGDPQLSGRALLVKALEAKTPPALAPGVMIQLGLLGLAYTYRYQER
jgi:hypothetical protein